MKFAALGRIQQREPQLVQSAHLEPTVPPKELVRVKTVLKGNILSVRQIRAYLVRAGNIVRPKRACAQFVVRANSAVETPPIARSVILAAIQVIKRALVQAVMQASLAKRPRPSVRNVPLERSRVVANQSALPAVLAHSVQRARRRAQTARRAAIA